MGVDHTDIIGVDVGKANKIITFHYKLSHHLGTVAHNYSTIQEPEAGGLLESRTSRL